MRKSELVNISGIFWDELPINRTVLDLVFFIISGGEIPPIKIIKFKDGYKLKDGRHRIAACKLLGKDMIMAKFYEPLISDL